MAAPTIASINPTAAAPGEKVIITGTGFSTATAVRFGGYDALFFEIISSTVIWAYTPIMGDTLIQVINPQGTGTKTGFHKILTQVKLTDLPVLGRPATTSDLMYAWDIVTGKLCQAPFQQPAVPSDGGTTGNVYTALGSPFKVRKSNVDMYEYDSDSNSTTVTDIRLIGKEDYVVTATDLNGEINDDRIDYNSVDGSFTISNYELTDNHHITVYADGVLTDAFRQYELTLQADIASIKRATAPFRPSLNTLGTLAAPGGIVAWFRPANEIPTGWAEWLPGRGRMLIGQNPDDVPGDGVINPLNGANGTGGGSKYHTIDSMNKIIKHRFLTVVNGTYSGNPFPDAIGRGISLIRSLVYAWNKGDGGGKESYYFAGSDADNIEPTLSPTNYLGKDDPDPIVHLNPYRIVNFIYSTETP